jgi:DNA-binding NtrC family response regulator
LPSTLRSDTDRPVPFTGLLGLTLKEIESSVILQTYEALGTVKATAHVLGISPRKIHYRLKEYRKQTHLRERELLLREQNLDATARARLMQLRVLLAEDDDDLRWALSDLLKTDGYDVVAVADGRALLEHLGAAMLLEQRDAPPDLIISDIRMPGLTGMQLLECVRNRGWSTPVVLISAFGDDDTRRQAQALGATAFLGKPIDMNELQTVIQRVVSH